MGTAGGERQKRGCAIGDRVSFVRVNERPFGQCSYIMQRVRRAEGRRGGGGRKEEGGRERGEGFAVTGTVWLDVEEFRSDGESKGPVRERPGPFEV